MGITFIKFLKILLSSGLNVTRQCCFTFSTCLQCLKRMSWVPFLYFFFVETFCVFVEPFFSFIETLLFFLASLFFFVEKLSFFPENVVDFDLKVVKFLRWHPLDHPDWYLKQKNPTGNRVVYQVTNHERIEEIPQKQEFPSRLQSLIWPSKPRFWRWLPLLCPSQCLLHF